MDDVDPGARPRRQRGDSIVELGLALPVLLLVFSGMLDLGRAYYFEITGTDAARDTVRVAAANYSGSGPSLATICASAANDLSNLASVSCQAINHAPPYVAGTDYTPPPANQATVLVYCGPSGACGSYSGPQRHDTLAVGVFYGFPTLTPGMNNLVPSGLVQMHSTAQMVANW